MSKEKSCGKIDEKDLKNVAGGSGNSYGGSTFTTTGSIGRVTNSSNDGNNTGNNNTNTSVLSNDHINLTDDIGDGDKA